MTVPSVLTGLCPIPLTALLDSDRVEVRRPVGLASLARLDRLGRPSGPVVARGDRVAFLLAPDTAEAVPELLHWLGWGAELRLGLTARAAEPPRVPRPRGAEEAPPRPAPRPEGRPAVWLRPAGPVTGLDLRSPDLLRLLDCLADACARDLMGLAPAS
ncbi:MULTISPECIES: hypothetical protein [unclassified Kitasatospora]|uniref:hypothetical protein n=1 Tax=unclassified Kitasatospora TaxID=2633591 RepID=UPI00070C7CE5|nr:MULTISPECIES: hypothetical protein [unclassified Kitasatospora]KQV18680.1 hypothetical protein ASC99_05595 [Kitasatospora sp. Root107]KRB74662.1 hypothetical protein ASE03_19530 [Kitasatospora sp. Root187]